MKLRARWRYVAAAAAFVAVLLVPFCVCFQQPVVVGQGHCDGMPAEDGQGSTAPACCSVVPPPHLLVTAAFQSHTPSMTVDHLIREPEVSYPEQVESTWGALLQESPPHCSSILRI